MIALISPAKSLNFERPVPDLVPTRPRFEPETARLVRGAKRLPAAKLGELMGISDALATLNAARYRAFDAQPERPAIHAFAGDVYAGFDMASFDPDALPFAQAHLRILSGLYGLLRPLDLIRPYRLEMGTRWAPRADDLYAFWGKKVAKLLLADLDEAGGARVVVNLASKEYAQVATPHLGKARVLTIDFRERGPRGLRFNTFAGKRARGAMARFMCEHRLDDPEGLKGFDADGYAFDAELSGPDKWMFVRG